MATEPIIDKVRIFNSEVNTYYYLYVRPDRLREFSAFVLANRRADAVVSPIPGLSWSAILGLDSIFAQRPKKFPTLDILDWLRLVITADNPEPEISIAEIENALERFSTIHPPDVGATEDA